MRYARRGREQSTGVGVLPLWTQRAAWWSWAFIGSLLALTLLVTTLAALSDLVVPLMIAVVAAVAVAPAVDALQRRGVPRGVGAAAITSLVVVFAMAMVAMVAIGVGDRSDELSAQLEKAWGSLADIVGTPTFAGFIDSLQLDLDGAGSVLLRGAGVSLTELIGSAVGLVSGLVLALVLLFYLLKDGHGMIARAVASRPAPQREQAERILGQAASTLRVNSRARTIISAIQGVFVTLVLSPARSLRRRRRLRARRGRA